MAGEAQKLNDFAQAAGAEIKKLQDKIAALPTGGGSGNAQTNATQDTGWRRVNSDNLTDGYLVMRRIGNVCYITATGGIWGTVTVKKTTDRPAYTGNNENKMLLLAANGLPIGFTPEVSAYGGVFRDDGEPFGLIYIHAANDSRTISIRGKGKFNASGEPKWLRVATVTYITKDPWPSSLPGAAL